MNAESLYSEDYVEMWKMIEESFGTLCNIWDEIGIHSQEARDKMKSEYVRSFKDVLMIYVNQTGTYKDLVLNFPNLYNLIQDTLK